LSGRQVLVAAAVLAMAGTAGRAEARVFDLRAGVRAGGIDGWGSSSTTPDFFNHTSGGAAGFELGARLLIFDVSANFLQVLNSNGRVGTLTQLLGGIQIDVPVGQAKLPNGKSQNIFRPGFVAGFGFGTAGPVHPPLDNAQVSDKGIVSQIEIGYEHFLGPFLGIGVEGDLGWHYFLGGQVINSSLDYSSGPHVIGLGTLTFHLGI
jgi:hypothetical protein